MNIQINLKQSLARTIQYQEKHVRDGLTECIHTDTFPKSKTAIKALHIIISMDHKHVFDKSILKEIANDYMKEINLHTQPFRAYWHKSWCSHIHIVTAKNSPQSKIPRFYYDKSIFHRLKEKHLLKISDLSISRAELSFLDWEEKIIYGKTPIHTTFNIVLHSILYHFHYKSMEELNVILHLFRMEACVADKNAATPHKGNLVYYQIDTEGNRKQPFILPCELKDNWSLEWLEDRFKFNMGRFVMGSQDIRYMMEWAFAISPLTLADFKTKMESCGILIVFQHGKEGNLENVWYAHYGKVVVIDGATLGGEYTVDALTRRCVPEGTYTEEQRLKNIFSWRKVELSINF